MIYQISHTEIKRRKIAYLTLSTSVIVGVLIFSIILNSPIYIGGLLAMCAMFLIGAYSFRFLKNLTTTKIGLNSQSLKRIINGNTHKYLLSKVNKIRIKWTTNDTVREMYIWLNDGNSIFISALENFERFKKKLVASVNKAVKVEEIHEPIDYDHPLFYSILGLPIGYMCVLIYKLVPVLSLNNIKLGLISFSAYLILLGVYFIKNRPISRRSGEKALSTDYIIGLLMISFGGVILFLLPQIFNP